MVLVQWLLIRSIYRGNSVKSASSSSPDMNLFQNSMQCKYIIQELSAMMMSIVLSKNSSISILNYRIIPNPHDVTENYRLLSIPNIASMMIRNHCVD